MEWLGDAWIALAAFWPVVALVALPFLLSTTVAGVFYATHSVLDRRNPIELPLTTLEWVEQQLQGLGLAHTVRAGPTPPGLPGVDAYWPHADYIGLQPGTIHRRDPAYWAIGAHEIGHALHIRASRWAAVIFPAARGLTMALDRVFAAFVVANMLYGSELGMSLAKFSLVAACVTGSVVMADEIWASHSARRVLAAEPRLNKGQRRRAYLALGVAGSAYAASMVGRVAVLALWPLLAGLVTGGHGVTGFGLPLPILFLVFSFTLPLLKRALRVTWHIVRPVPVQRLSELSRQITREHAGDLGGGLGALCVIAILWNQPLGAAFQIAVLLAAIPALTPVSGLLGSLVTMPIALLVREVDRQGARHALLEGGVIPQDHRSEQSLTQTLGLSMQLHNNPSFTLRALDLLKLSYVPMLVLWWVHWLGHTVAAFI